jgi:hypothetical protein
MHPVEKPRASAALLLCRCPIKCHSRFPDTPASSRGLLDAILAEEPRPPPPRGFATRVRTVGLRTPAGSYRIRSPRRRRAHSPPRSALGPIPFPRSAHSRPSYRPPARPGRQDRRDVRQGDVFGIAMAPNFSWRSPLATTISGCVTLFTHSPIVRSSPSCPARIPAPAPPHPEQARKDPDVDLSTASPAVRPNRQ